MKISTKGRYSLNILIELAKSQVENKDNYVSLKTISESLDTSFKYLEKMANFLVKNKYIDVSRGKNGGYRLIRPVEEYNIGEILKLTEKNMEQLECVINPGTCKNMSTCKKQKIFIQLDEVINEYLSQFTLKDIM